MTWTSRAFRSLLAAASVLCVALAAAPAGAQCQGSTGGACPWGLTEYATETVFGQGSTTGIRVGPDGALWFVQPDTTHKLGRITTGGQVTYPLANPTFDGNVAPSVQTASGPITSVTGGALWIPYSQTLVQMPTDGSPGLHYFSDAQKPPAASPYHQVSAIGWDGATMIRFVDFVNGSKLGSFDLSKGTLAEVAFPPCPGPVSERTEVNSIGADMALAPDGGLWLSGFANATRIARDGTVSCVSMPKFTSDGITYSPYDRRIWVSAHAHPNFLQAFDPTTCHDAGCVSVYTLPAPVGELHGLTAGPDGRIWFVGGNPELIGSVMTDGSDFQ
jgi:virginiamycin B lyase